MSDMNFASLSPSLLARKGGAKPAMRRQSIAVAGAVPQHTAVPQNLPDDALEDLGWNDLGEESQADVPAEDANPAEAITPEEAEQVDESQFAPLDRHASSTSSEELHTAQVTPIGTVAPRLPRPRLAVSSQGPSEGESKTAGKRTAFTLRLDAERHLKLRMASTLAGRSAQALVTEAVDAMFADIPELDALVARVKPRPHKEG